MRVQYESNLKDMHFRKKHKVFSDIFISHKDHLIAHYCLLPFRKESAILLKAAV